MKYRRILAALLVGLLALSGVALAGGEDFLVTLSWLKENLTEKVAEELEDGAAQMEEEVLASIGSNKTNKNQNTTLSAAEIDGLVSKVAAQLQPSGGSSTSQLTLARGAQVTGPLGGGMILLIGNVIEQEFSFTANWHLGSGLSLILMIFILFSMFLIAKYDKEGNGTAF